MKTHEGKLVATGMRFALCVARFNTFITERLLEAGFGTYWSQWGGTAHPGSNFAQLVGVTEQCTAGCAVNGGIESATL